MADVQGFDEYCDEHGIKEGEEGAAFAAWLHEQSGGEWDGKAEPIEVACAPDGTCTCFCHTATETMKVAHFVPCCDQPEDRR